MFPEHLVLYHSLLVLPLWKSNAKFMFITLLHMTALVDSNLVDLTLISKGKVRDVYLTSSPDHLLFVASDRISAYDVILKNVCIFPRYDS